MTKNLIKKVIVTSLMLSGVNSIYESIKKETPELPKLRYILSKNMAKTREENRELLLKRARLSGEDKIYQMICSYYTSENFIIPEHISPEFVRALIKHESGDNPEAISKVGARGHGQFMEATWYDVSKEDYFRNAFNPKKNIKATIMYLCLLENKFLNRYPNWEILSPKRKLDNICAAYNGGIIQLEDKNWDINKMKPETKNYVRFVNRQHNIFKEKLENIEKTKHYLSKWRKFT